MGEGGVFHLGKVMKECNPPSTLNMKRLGLKPFAKMFDEFYDFPRAAMYFLLLVECALNRRSMEFVCKRKFEASDRLFHYMARRTLEESTRYCNHMLGKTYDQLRKTRRQWKRMYLAIDHNDIEYYGDDPLMVHDAMKRKGAQYQHVHVLRYATLCLVGPRFKYTLAIMPVCRKDRIEDTVKGLLKLTPPDLRVKGLLMDKEFYNSSVLKTVENMGFEYVVPGKKYREMTITYRLSEVADKWRWKYTMNRGKIDEYQTKAYITEKGLDDYVCFVSNKDMSILDDQVLILAYRYRWNIENSYKETGEFRVRTNSKNHAYRALVYTLGHLLMNLHTITNIQNKTGITSDDMKLVLETLLTIPTPLDERITKKLRVIA